MFPDPFFNPQYFPPGYFPGTGNVPPPPIYRGGFLVTDKACSIALTHCTSSIWATLTIRLFQNQVLATRQTIRTDLVECDFYGYVPVTIAAGPTGSGNPYFPVGAEFPPVMWIGNDDGPGNDVYGYWIEDASENVLFIGNVGAFPSFIPMYTQDDYFVVNAVLSAGSQY